MKFKHIKYSFLFLLAQVFASFAIGQQSDGTKKEEKNRVKILHADRWDHDPSVADAQRLIGHVKLQYNQALMDCDSAYIFSNENFDAYGNVRVRRGDTLYMESQVVQFDQEAQKAHFIGDVLLRNKGTSLRTDQLDYDLSFGLASYYTGGTLTSKENNNTLTSDQGVFDSNRDILFFKKNVVLVNKDFEVRSDTLDYHNKTEKAFFSGPTTIIGESTNIYCENGWFDTKKNLCQFNRNARILSGSTTLKGDSIFYNANQEFGEIFCNVHISDSTSDYTISGDYGWHNESIGRSFVTDRALLTQRFDDDTLFMHTDTLEAIKDALGFNIVKAYQHVRFFSNDLQGVSDSMIYAENDSILNLIGNPILWSQDNQLTGEFINIKLWDGKIHRLNIEDKAFINSQVTDSAFNQISGRNMVGHFRENKLNQIHVEGNGQTIYYPVQEGSKPLKTVGMNKVECSKLVIHLAENDIKKVVMIDMPDGVLIPNSMVQPSEKKLDGFKWHPELRPQTKADIWVNP